jgi:hypothetical protein
METLDLTLDNFLIDRETLQKQKISDLISMCNIDLSEEIKRPESLISIGTHVYKNNTYPTDVCTAGEFSAIVGTSKSKKSFFKSALIASYIGGSSNLLMTNMEGHRKEEFSILDFDTEQGKYYCQRTFRRVPEMVGGLYDNYFTYSLRAMSCEQKLDIIQELIDNQENYFKNPVKLVMIDGIADLLDNFNDIEKSNRLAESLLRWTDTKNIHISTVIHRGQGTDKPLGHLGTFLTKKCETIFDMQKENDIIKVQNTFSRGVSFKPFYFDVNSNGLPFVVNENIF